VELPFSQERTEEDDKNIFYPINFQTEEIDGNKNQRDAGKQNQCPLFGYEIIDDRNDESKEMDELAANFRT